MKTKETSNISNNWKMYTISVVLSLISAIIFALWQHQENRNLEIMVFTHYGIFLFLFFSNSIIKLFKIKTWQNTYATYPIIVSGIISCFALNRIMELFYISTDWWSTFIVINMGILLFKPVLEFGGKYIKTLLYISLVCSAFIFLYYSIILIPSYPFGLIGIIVLGIGIHAFIPILSFVYILFNLFKVANENKYYYKVYLATSSVVVLLIVLFVVRWNSRVNSINNQVQYLELNKEKDIPKWMYVAQKLPANKLSKKILLTNILYPNFDKLLDFRFNGFNTNNNLNIQNEHDPLIGICSLFTNEINLTENDIIRVLESCYDASYLTEQRLWSGNNLSTTTMITNIRIYPKQRLSYTEKIINIQNNNSYNSNQQEAIYTFYLPEGAAVSSLSLWIDGNEEPAYLSSKSKATKAYTTIVGVEKRDPSVVHWQEGNKVSVRVFPCTPKEARKFKIGISAPLSFINNELNYSNILCKGPDLTRTKEVVQVNFADTVNRLTKPYFLKNNGNNYLIGKHQYQDWNISFYAPKEVSGVFHFKDKSYYISNSRIKTIKSDFSNIFLDVNQSWTKKEWNAIVDSFQDRNIFVFQQNWTKVSDENKDELFKQMKVYNFNVVPFYEIKTPNKSIVITKSDDKGPSLSELKTYNYFKQTYEYFINNNLKVLNIGNENAALYKTLKEYDAIQINNTTLDNAISQLKNNVFMDESNTDSLVYLNNGTSIKCMNKLDVQKTAPDHVFRLFAYNEAMHQMSMESLQNDSIATLAYELVSDANVVSPISSLIVLETQKDYDRFDIKKDDDALANANIHNDGAVPEPHEWMLIIVLALAFIYINLKTSKYAYLFR